MILGAQRSGQIPNERERYAAAQLNDGRIQLPRPWFRNGRQLIFRLLLACLGETGVHVMRLHRCHMLLLQVLFMKLV